MTGLYRRRAKVSAAILSAAVMIAAMTATGARAASCGNTAAGFPAWVEAFKKEAASKGVSQRTIGSALSNLRYATKTIRLDRSQRSFKLSLNQFMRKRGASAIISRGKGIKQANARLFGRIESQYGVPPGVLIAIWGMETGFGSYTGNQDAMSALATLAYDCRRSAFFKKELYAALTIIERGELTRRQMRGAGHGELGQTQFLPSNYVRYAVDADRNGRRDLIRSRADALASTANYLKAHGWRRGAGYQPGQPNFRVLKEWNAAGVYQKAIAIIGAKIDE